MMKSLLDAKIWVFIQYKNIFFLPSLHCFQTFLKVTVSNKAILQNVNPPNFLYAFIKKELKIYLSYRADDIFITDLNVLPD